MKNPKVLAYTLAAVVVGLMVAIFAAAAKHDREAAELPRGATEVTELGHGWRTFRLDGRKILLHQADPGRSDAAESMTMLAD